MATTGTAIIDFGATAGDTASIDITGQTGITGTSYVDAWIVPSVSTDHSVDEHLLEDLDIMAGNVVAGTGFTIYAICRVGSAYGKFNIQWAWN